MAQLNLRVSADPSQLKKDLDEMTSATKKGAEEMGASVDKLSFKQSALNAQYDLAVNKAATLAARHGQESIEALKAASAAERLALKVKEASAATAASATTAQTTSARYNGLQNSVNQLTREMPAFTNSVQTGFMAISNNLPIFFDQISAIKAANKELAAAGQATKSVASQVASSMFSWGTALSVGITALTVLGPQLITYIGQLDEADEAQKRLAQSTKDLAAQEQKYADIIKGTNDLRLQAMKDGINKERSAALQAYKDGLNDLVTKHQNEEIADITYNMRKQLLWEIYQNKLTDITKKEQEKRSTSAYKAYEDDLAAQKWVQKELEKIRKKPANLTGLQIGEKPVLSAPTKLDFQLDVGQATQTGKSQIAIMYEEFKMGIIAGNQSLEQLMQGIGKSLKDATNATFANVGSAIGTGIANGFDGSGFDSFAKSMGQTLSSLASQIGMSLIAFGTPLLFVPGTQAQGLAYVAGGIAMTAAGSFIASKLGGGSSSGGGGSSSGGSTSSGATTGWGGNGGFNTGFGATANNLQLSTRVSGRDLEIVNGRQGYFSRRVTG